MEHDNFGDVADPKAIHICNSLKSTHKPKIAKEYVFANAD
jgi:hypothetical protein